MKKYNFIEDIVVDHDQLIDMSRIVSSEINEFYSKESELIVIAIMNGGLSFTRSLFSSGYISSDLNVTHYTLNKEDISNIQLGLSYGIEKLSIMLKDIKNTPVLIVDDIYDTGETLDKVVSLFKKYCPASIEYCVMIERNCAHVFDINVRFVGTKVDTQKYLVGAGLDFQGTFRDLPYVGTLKPEFYGDPIEQCFCNKCGKLCISSEAIKAGEDRQSCYGLINAIARGYYFSPVLHDCMAYKFDLCEICLKELFDNFKVPVEEQRYDPWTGAIYE